MSSTEQADASRAPIAGTADDTTKSRQSLNPLLALAPYLLKYKAALAATIIALIFSSGATLTVPVAIRRMIDYGFASNSGEQGLIHKYFAVLLLVGGVLAIASSARAFFVNWLGERVIADLRTDVFQHLTKLSPFFFEKTHSGEVMSRLTADTTQIKTAVGIAASQTLRNLVMLTGALIMMFVTSIKLSLMVLIAIPIIVLPLMFYGRKVRALSREAQDKLADASSYANENLGAFRTLLAFTNERAVTARYDTAVETSFQAALARLKARAGLTAIAIFLTFASIIGVLWFGASLVLDGEMSGGRLSQFVLYAVFAAGGMAELSEVWTEIQQAAGAAERLNELLDQKPDIVSPADAMPIPAALPGTSGKGGRISFEEVTFKYPSRPEQSALDNISFDIEPGETVALVGPSGSGKTTIFALLMRFYDIESGKISVNGLSVDRADLAELRNFMALVPQDVVLFADTVAENIRYGRADADRKEVVQSAKTAVAHDFIEALPDGYDTQLGERGATLSGGQQQRIGIARAVLRDAPILLLDEATSALDTENERLIQDALEKVMRDRTTLVIAHRLATVQSADRILVMDSGRIVEQGTHAELIGREGAYAKLARLQFQQAAE